MLVTLPNFPSMTVLVPRGIPTSNYTSKHLYEIKYAPRIPAWVITTPVPVDIPRTRRIRADRTTDN